MQSKNLSSEFRKYKWIFLAMIILHTLDLLTTYYVVCHNHGIEINSNTVQLVNLMGFIPASIVQTAVITSFFFLVTYFWRNMKINGAVKLIFFLMIFLSAPIFAVVNNSSVIFTNLNIAKMMTPEWNRPTENYINSFDYDSFCRLY